MNGNGASSSDAGDIVTTNDWDDSSRLLRSGDGAGNLTETTYDALGRAITTTHADGSRSGARPTTPITASFRGRMRGERA